MNIYLRSGAVLFAIICLFKSGVVFGAHPKKTTPSKSKDPIVSGQGSLSTQSRLKFHRLQRENHRRLMKALIDAGPSVEGKKQVCLHGAAANMHAKAEKALSNYKTIAFKLSDEADFQSQLVTSIAMNQSPPIPRAIEQIRGADGLTFVRFIFLKKEDRDKYYGEYKEKIKLKEKEEELKEGEKGIGDSKGVNYIDMELSSPLIRETVK